MIYRNMGTALICSILCVSTFAQVIATDTIAAPVKKSAVDEIEEAVRAAELAIEESVKKEESKLLRKEKERGVINFTSDDTLHLYGESFNGLSLLAEEVKGKKVFITGENHTFTESNARLWLKMIKYLHANAGVRNIMFEYGYSYGFLVNEYLKTGDTTLFNSFNQFAYDEYSQAIKELKDFNDSLPEDEKLYFSAIDIERGVYPIPKILSYLLPKTGTPSDSISLHVQSIRSLASYNDFKLDQEDNDKTEFNFSPGFQFKTNATLNLVHDNFLKFQDDYKIYLGVNFEEFKSIIVKHYLARKQWLEYENDGAIQEYIYRENFMHQRFLEEQASHAGNWFGQFGRCHTTQTLQNSNSCEWFEFNSLADRIKNTPGDAFIDKVMSIAIIYNGDRYTSPDRKTVEEEFDKYFDDVDDNSIVLLDISKDSILQDAFGADFNYIFLNRYEKGAAESVYDIYDDYGNSDVGLKITFGYSDWNLDLNSLLFALPLLSVESDFPETLENFEMNISTKVDRLLTTGTTIGWSMPRSFSFESNDEISFKVNHFFIKNFFYFDLTPSSPIYDLMPGFGLGYARLRMRGTEHKNGNQDLSNGWLGELRNYTYTNPAFMGDVRFAIEINFRKINIGYVTGYNLDFSNKTWKSENTLLDFGPSTSYKGSFSTFYVGLNF